MKRIVSIFFLAMLSLYLSAQQILNDKEYYDFLLDEIINETEDENIALEILQELEEKIQHPVNINSATISELQELYVLSEFQVFSILEFRRKYGLFLSLNELQLIPGIHNETIQLIRPMICLNEIPVMISDASNYKPSINQKILLRTSISHPFKSGNYQNQDSLKTFHGKPFSGLLKYEMERKGFFRVGLTMEKDPGEKIAWEKNQRGADFTSGYLELYNKGPFKKIIAGDFRLATGNGLVYGYGRAGKSSAIHIKQNANGIKKYSSSAEYGFMRGIAADVGIKNFRSIFYVSSLCTDASFETVEEKSIISTLINSGLHRNDDEISKKNNVKQMNWGGSLIFESNHLDMGYNFSKTHFDKELKYRILPNRYSKTGLDNSFVEQSFFYAGRYGNVMIGGEIALDENWHPATIHNLSAQLHPLISLQLSYRNYHPSYQSFKASSLAESGGISNETGFYAGSIFYPMRFLKISFYTDKYRFPWYTYASNMPYHGKDYLIKTDFIFNHDMEMFILYKKEYSFINIDNESLMVNKMKKQLSQRIVFQCKYNFSMKFSLRTKIEVKTSKEPGEKWQGSFMAQDINLKLLQNKLIINARYALFDVPDWSVRIYSWESDVFSAFSSPLFYRRGSRTNMVFKLNLGDKLDLWMKYAQTNYSSEVISGTGTDKRIGKCFREMKIQMNLKF